MNFKNTIEFAKELDSKDELKEYRNKFHIPLQENGKDHIYLCGNSLGLQAKKTKSFIMNVINLKKSNYCRIDPRMDNELIRNGAYSKYLIDNIPFTLIDLKIAGNIIEKEIKSNKSFLVYKKGVPKIVDIIKGYQ